MKKILNKRWAAYTIATCSAVILYMLLSHIAPIIDWVSSLWKMLSPVVAGCVLAYLMTPVMNYLENKPLQKIKKEKVRHILGVVLSVIFVILIITAIIMMVVPSLISSISDLISAVNKYGYSNITALLEEFNNFDIGFKIDISKFDMYIDQGLDALFTALKNNLSNILDEINNIGSSLFNIILGFIIAVYLLIGKSSVKSAVHEFRKSLLTKERYKKNSDFWKRCNEIFIQYIGCSLLDGFIIGTVNAVFMLIFRMDNITLISVIVGVTNLLPTFGPIIGAIIGAFFLVITNPMDALIFIIFSVILQAIDGYVIKPKLFSSSLGLSPVLSLIAIILGGKMFGFIGILLSIPVTAVLVMIYNEQLLPLLQKRTAKKESKLPHNEEKINKIKKNTAE